MIISKINGKIKSIITAYQYSRSKKSNSLYSKDFDLNSFATNFPTRNQQYNYFHHYFWFKSPEWLKSHRDYFKQDFRGYGEDAFHAMWYNIFKEFAPKKALEIGVYRGQVISLWALLSDQLGTKTQISAISPFSPAGDHVSVYLKNIDYYQDVVKNCSVFSKNTISLNKGYSTDPDMIDAIKSQTWDLIYIDGNHDYEVVKKDFEVCSQALNKNGLIILDDASLYSDYKPRSFSTAGHPGPSQMAEEIDRKKFVEILSVGHNRVFQKVA
jgi:hypothetical protein